MYRNNMDLNDKQKLYIKNHALEEAPNECCGLIVERGGDIKVIKCENASYNKERHFEISSSDLLQGYKHGKIVAYYHSHTQDNIEFSGLDESISLSHNLPLFMYSIHADNFLLFEP